MKFKVGDRVEYVGAPTILHTQGMQGSVVEVLHSYYLVDWDNEDRLKVDKSDVVAAANIFQNLPREEQVALFTAFLDGKGIESYITTDNVWVGVNRPTWFKDSIYRVKPVEVIPDCVDWPQINSEWKYMTRSEEGVVYLHTKEPYIVGGRWSSSGRISYMVLSSYKKGNTVWNKSLVNRP